MLKNYLTLLMVLCTINIFASETTGTSCSDALIANVGVNTALNSSNDQWYTYTASGNALITLSSCGETNQDTKVYIYKDCSSSQWKSVDDNCGLQSEVQFILNEGEVVYINWARDYNSNSGDYNWSLTEQLIEIGDLCEYPISANSSNVFSKGESEELWYSYTPSKSGKIQLSNITDNGDSEYSIYMGCNSAEYSSGSMSGSIIIEAGQEYLIKWINNTNTDFEWTIDEVDFSEGEDCSTAISVQEGSLFNYSFSNGLKQWYRYTASKDCNIYINNLTSDEIGYYKIYNRCGGSSLYSGSNSHKFDAVAGQEYLFCLYNDNSKPLNWILTEVDYLPGENCSIAVAAEARNEHNIGGYTDQWFTYTATQTGKIKLKNLSSQPSSSYYIYDRCDSYYSYIFSGSDEGEFAVEVGVRYYIRWNNHSSDNFDWSLEEVDFDPGEVCSAAITATADSENEHNFGNYIDQWFTYTATRTGKIALKNLNESGSSRCEVYTNCGNTYGFTHGYEECSFEAQIGITYQIKWRNYNSDNFKWSLEELDFVPGEICSVAITASEDSENEHNMGSYKDQWYTYTASQTGKITIKNLSESADSYYNVYEGCGNFQSFASGGEEGSFHVESGITYKIKWRNYQTVNFKWSLIESDFDPGEVCSSAIVATADGENEHIFGYGEYQWYTYTATQTGKITLKNLSSFADSYYTIYTECGDSYSYNSGSEEGYFAAESGITYKIKWQNHRYENFKWSLEESDFEPGEICSVAIDATADNENEHTLGYRKYQWYTYTANQKGKIVIKNLSEFGNSKYEIYRDCNNNYLIDSGEEEGFFKAEAGESYIIKLYNYNAENFKWSLEELDFGLGEDCSNPTLATADEENEHIYGAGRYQWYTYTATKNGKISLKNLREFANSRYEVYTECGKTYSPIYGEKEGFFASESGTTYFIAWGNYRSENFKWSLEELDIEPGDFCDNPIIARDDIVNTTTMIHSKQWFSYTAKQTGRLTIKKTIDDNNSNSFRIYKSCNNRLFYSTNSIEFFAEEGRTYLIEWENNYDEAFEWEIEESDYEIGEHCSSANYVDEGDAHTLESIASQGAWYYYVAKENGVLNIDVKGYGHIEIGVSDGCSSEGYTDTYQQNKLAYNINKGRTYYFYIKSSRAETLSFSLSEGDYVLGSTCSTGIPVELDNTYTTQESEDAYYMYTAESSGKLTFSAPNVSYIPHVHLIYQCNSTIYYEPTKEHSIYVMEGDVISIHLRNYWESFDWRITLTQFEDAEYCGNANEVAFDANITHNSEIGKAEYSSITTTKSGKVLIQSLTEDCDASVKVFNSCASNNKSIVDGLNTSYFAAEEGVTYYIEWVNNTSKPFEWKVSEEEFNEREICETATVVESYIDYTLSTNILQQWYQYTPPEDVQVNINTEDDNYDVHIILRSDCNNILGGRSSQYSFAAKGGHTYYFSLINYSDQDYDWNITTNTLEVGDLCSSAIELNLNTDYTSTLYNTKWYTYTAGVNGIAEITNNVNIVWYKDCGGNYYDTGSTAEVIEGEVYLLKIESWSFEENIWQITEREYLDAETCEDATIALIDDVNYLDNGQETKWYTYTATKTGKTTLISKGSLLSNNVSVQSGCYTTVSESGNGRLEFTAYEGTTYYLLWKNNSNMPFEWTITEGEEFDLGEGCYNPINVLANESLVHVSTIGKEIWYSYTALEDKTAEILTEDYINTNISVYNECNGSEISQYNYYNGNKAFAADKGITYLIKIVTNTSWSLPYFDWSIRLSELLPGEFCNSANSAVIGSNHKAVGRLEWFEYSPEEDEEIKLSSCDKTSIDTYVGVYTSCPNLRMLGSNDDKCGQQSELVFNALAGAQYYIVWFNYSGDEAFEWDLSVVGDNAVKKTDYTSFSMYPNPANSYININSVNIIGYVRILSTQGLVVQENSNPTSQLKLNLNKGIYIVEVYFENGSTATQKLIIQ